MILTTLRIGGRATFTCNEGFSLKGDDDIECLSSGSWSSWPPTCLEVDCGQPYDIENGRVFLTNGTTNIGSIVEYHCFPGEYRPGRPNWDFFLPLWFYVKLIMADPEGPKLLF